MPRDEGTILVKPVEGELGLRFMVESWTNPTQPHYVDLAAGNGASECSCKHWQCRVGPALKKGADPYSHQGSCRHVRAVRRFWLKHALTAVIAAHKQGKSSY